jgi:hypothetical protein
VTAAQKPQKEKRERDRHSRATLIVPRREERRGVVPVAPPPAWDTIGVAQP